MARIELSDMIVGLRNELEEARKKAEKESLKFTVESIDVEAQVTVSLEADVKGAAKWKFWIFGEASGEVGASAARETVQTIRLTLKPKPYDGQTELEISGLVDMPPE